MSTFIIRNQGFFYTDEYFEPCGQFRKMTGATFATRAEAEAACARHIRTWVRSLDLFDYLFDDEDTIDVVEYFRTTWPEYEGDAEWDRDFCIPDDATDAQVDEIVKRMKVTFAQVFEVSDSDPDSDEGSTDEDNDDQYPDLDFGAMDRDDD